MMNSLGLSCPFAGCALTTLDVAYNFKGRVRLSKKQGNVTGMGRLLMSWTTSSVVRGLPVAPGPGEHGVGSASDVADDSDVADGSDSAEESWASGSDEGALCVGTDVLCSVAFNGAESSGAMPLELAGGVLHAIDDAQQTPANMRLPNELVPAKPRFGSVRLVSGVNGMCPS